ncbi:hypothetical protein PHET_07170 [Paragonimus heterotremus]|uniref:Uncharacterized protein n=1 Tax=Paragonimus heterotremus TaxID=100268 RepID=A0A8J4WGN6_9TREM|nr:hypothetical protein PHET_07170 [Paragonimus heterotremus]
MTGESYSHAYHNGRHVFTACAQVVDCCWSSLPDSLTANIFEVDWFYGDRFR